MVAQIPNGVGCRQNTDTAAPRAEGWMKDWTRIFEMACGTKSCNLGGAITNPRIW